jgi:hypothetical protein
VVRRGCGLKKLAVEMQANEIIVTWWCCQCNKSGRLVFQNQNTVGERLDSAKRDHRALSPDCELDWNRVFVQTEIDEHGE